MDQRQTFGSPISGQSVKVAYTGTAGTTAALPANTKAVRVIATTDCFIDLGPTATAVADTGLYLAAYSPEYFPAYGSWKVSAIQASSGGTIYVTPF